MACSSTQLRQFFKRRAPLKIIFKKEKKILGITYKNVLILLIYFQKDILKIQGFYLTTVIHYVICNLLVIGINFNHPVFFLHQSSLQFVN